MKALLVQSCTSYAGAFRGTTGEGGTVSLTEIRLDGYLRVTLFR